MKKVIVFLLALVSFASTCVTFTSCSENKNKVPQLGKSNSAPYELLLVANKDWLKTMAGQSLSVVLDSPIEGLPQPESHFHITSINPNAFDGTFKYYANVIVVKIGKEYPEKKVSMVTDAYCKPQLILYLEAPDDEQFIQLVRERAESILSIFDARELARERTLLEKNHSGQVFKQSQTQFEATLCAPKDIDDIKTGKDFFWASASKQEFRLNICMYTIPLRNLSLEDFVAVRDSVMKINIPGDKEGQWMETDSRSVMSHEKNIEPDQHSVMVVTGLWDMRNDAMGGPFVSYVQPDYDKQRLIITEGFIFAPNENKRAMIRELEAALQTLVTNKK